MRFRLLNPALIVLFYCVLSPVDLLADSGQTSGGVQYRDIIEGQGEDVLEKNDKATVHFTGWIAKDNKQGPLLETSRTYNDPKTFRVGHSQVLKGWDEGVIGMKKGAKRMLVIPPELGMGTVKYGSALPSNATLIYEIELLEIVKYKGAQTQAGGNPITGRRTIQQQFGE